MATKLIHTSMELAKEYRQGSVGGHLIMDLVDLVLWRRMIGFREVAMFEFKFLFFF